jgi:hypothetical protein
VWPAWRARGQSMSARDAEQHDSNHLLLHGRLHATPGLLDCAGDGARTHAYAHSADTAHPWARHRRGAALLATALCCMHTLAALPKPARLCGHGSALCWHHSCILFVALRSPPRTVLPSERAWRWMNGSADPWAVSAGCWDVH